MSDSLTIEQTGVCIEIRPKHWLRIDGIPSNLTAKEAEKLKRFISGWQVLMQDAQTVEEPEVVSSEYRDNEK